MEDPLYQFFLSVSGIGPKKAKALLEAGFGTMESLRNADPEELAKVKGITPELAADIKNNLSFENGKEEGPSLYLCPGCGAFISETTDECPKCGLAMEEDEEDDFAQKDPGYEEETQLNAEPETVEGTEEKRPRLYLCPDCGAFLSESTNKCPMCGIEIMGEEEGDEDAIQASGWHKDTDKALIVCPICGNFTLAGQARCENCNAELPEEMEVETTSSWYKGEQKPDPIKSVLKVDEEDIPEEQLPSKMEDDAGSISLCPFCGAMKAADAEECAYCGSKFMKEKSEAPTEAELEVEKILGEKESEEIEASLLDEIAKVGGEEIGDGEILDLPELGEPERPKKEPGFEPEVTPIGIEDEEVSSKDLELVKELAAQKVGAEEPTASKVTEESKEKAMDDVKGTDITPDQLQDLELKAEPEMVMEPSVKVQRAVETPSIEKGHELEDLSLKDDEDEEAQKEVEVQEKDEVQKEERKAPKVDDSGVVELEPKSLDEISTIRGRKSLGGDFLARWQKLGGGKKEKSQDQRLKESLREYKRLLEADPSLVKVWERMGQLLARNGRWQEAIECFDQAAQLNPQEEADYRLHLLKMLQASYDPAKGAIDYQKWSVPTLEETESLKRTLRYYDFLVSMDPTLTRAWQVRGEILAKLHKYDEAIESFDQAIAQAKDARKLGFIPPEEEPGAEGAAVVAGGLVNGLSTRAGLTNGRGLTNGKSWVNGRTNGLKGGGSRVNGLTSKRSMVNGRRGMVNGKVNGMVNGLMQGQGLINGIGRTNGIAGRKGIVNGMGLKALAGSVGVNGVVNGIGFLNGRGLINGSGITNGYGRFYRPVSRRKQYNATRNMVLAALLISLILVVPVFYNFLYQITPQELITIDGDFDDWKGHHMHVDPLELNTNPSIDLTKASMVTSGHYLYVYLETAGDFFNTTKENIESMQVFFDTDIDPSTGYTIHGIGADFMVDYYGYEGRMRGNSLRFFNRSLPGHSFEGFNLLNGAKTRFNGNKMEMRIDKDLFRYNGKDNINAVIHTMGSQGREDIIDEVISLKPSTLQIFQSNFGHMFLSRSLNSPILKLEMEPHNGNVDIWGLDLHTIGNAEAEDMDTFGLYMDADGDENFTTADRMIPISYEVSGDGIQIRFRQNITLNENERSTLFVTTMPGAQSVAGTCIGAKLLDYKDVKASKTTPTITSKFIGNNYIETCYDTINIDGAFLDWENIIMNPDNLDDLDDEKFNPNIDMSEYTVFREGEYTSLYLKVDGIMMAGSDVPLVRTLPKPSDTDGDGIPNREDAYPNDFDNDAIIDELDEDKDNDGIIDWDAGGEDTSLINIITGAHRYCGKIKERDSDGDAIPDVNETGFERDFDNDGITDAQDEDKDNDGTIDWDVGGSDVWLVNYETRARKYIGPEELGEPLGPAPEKGLDIVRILIDTDNNTLTGYRAYPGIGGDFVVEVLGKGQDIISSRTLMFNGTLGQRIWNWDEFEDIDAAIDLTRMEVQFRILGMTRNTRILVYTTDWEENRDVADSMLETQSMDRGSGTRGPGDVEKTMYLHNGDTMDTQEGTVQQTFNIPSGSFHSWDQTPVFADDFNITEDMVVNLYLSPNYWWFFRPTLTVEVLVNGTVIGSDILNGLTQTRWYSIPITPTSLPYTVDAGEYVELRLSVSGYGSIDVNYDSGPYNSNITLTTDTFISVDDILLSNGTAFTNLFQPSDTVDIFANTSDPLGAYDIASANVTIRDPNGTVVYTSSMSTYQTDSSSPALWKVFDDSYTLPANAAKGEYTVEVEAFESNGVTSQSSRTFYVRGLRGVSIFEDSDIAALPNTWTDFDITLQNTGLLPDTYDIDITPSPHGWGSELYLGGNAVAIDSNGDGSWDWVNSSYNSDADGEPDFSLLSTQFQNLTLKRNIPPTADFSQTDEVDLIAVSQANPNINDTVRLTLNTPLAYPTKELYLHSGFGMSTIPGNSTVSHTIDNNANQDWVQGPSFWKDFSITSDYVSVYLYMNTTAATGLFNGGNPDVTVTLLSDGSTIGSDTVTNAARDGWYLFSVPVSGVPYNISSGEEITLRVSVTSAQAGWFGQPGYVDTLFDSSNFPARLVTSTTTYINVDSILTYNATAQTNNFSQNDIVEINANISDPFAAYDIVGATVQIRDPSNQIILPETPMSVLANGGTNWKLWNRSFTLPPDAPTGEYDVLVKGIESNGVVHYLSQKIRVNCGVTIEPDQSSVTLPGNTASYVHYINNTGKGTDVYEIHLDSSMGWNVSIYNLTTGSLMAIDTGGDGIWDWVNSSHDRDHDGNPDTGKVKMGDSYGIIVRIDVPGNAGFGVTDFTNVTVNSNKGDCNDSVVDITTTIPEYQNIIPPILFCIFLPIMMFYRRKRELGN